MDLEYTQSNSGIETLRYLYNNIFYNNNYLDSEDQYEDHLRTGYQGDEHISWNEQGAEPPKYSCLESDTAKIDANYVVNILFGFPKRCRVVTSKVLCKNPRAR